MAINPIGPSRPRGAQFPLPGYPGQPTKGNKEFTNLFRGMVSEANQQHLQAEQSVQNYVEGKDESLQSVAMTMAKADLSFRLVLEIRNKLVDAYQEIMRMQV